MRRGFLYLVPIMGWYSCKVLAWRLSNSMDAKIKISMDGKGPVIEIVLPLRQPA